MVIIGMIDQISNIKTMIGDLMGRLEEGHQFTIDYGTGSACMIGLVNVSVIFQETKRSLRRWQMHDFPMSLYFAWMLTLIGWNRGKFDINQ